MSSDKQFAEWAMALMTDPEKAKASLKVGLRDLQELARRVPVYVSENRGEMIDDIIQEMATYAEYYDALDYGRLISLGELRGIERTSKETLIKKIIASNIETRYYRRAGP